MHAAERHKPREPTPIARALEGFLAASGLSERLRHRAVFQAWSEVLGPELGRRARAVRFVHAELCVEVESAAHLHELSNFTGEQYRQLANARLGSEQIRRVLFQLKR